MATSLISTPRVKAVIISEASNQRSRENIVVTQTGTPLASGTLLTRSGDAGAGTFAMGAGATGNPTAGTITIGAAAIPGVYVIEFTAATKFTVKPGTDMSGVTPRCITIGLSGLPSSTVGDCS